MRMDALIGIGFWRSLLEPELPDPAWFVDAGWSQSEQQRVAHYLQQGQPLAYWMGYSWCRFRCDTSPAEMGAADCTDGTYCWPEGLAHYVVQHQVRLPENFIQHILRQPAFPATVAAQVPELSPVDMHWWQQQTGWQTEACSFPARTDEEAEQIIRRFAQEKALAPPILTPAAREARAQMIQQWRAKVS